MYKCERCEKDVLTGSIFYICGDCLSFLEGASKARPARFASSSGSASDAPSVQPPSCGGSAPEVSKLSHGKAEGESLDLSRAVQLPVSDSAVCLLIPAGEKKLGWLVDFDLLMAIADKVNSNDEMSLGLEELDEAIKALQTLGFCKVSANKQADARSATRASGGS
jgi:hypothetical protein